MLTCLIALPRPVLEKAIRYVSTGKNLLRKLVDIYTIFRDEKIPCIAKPNKPDMRPERTKKERLGLDRIQLIPATVT